MYHSFTFEIINDCNKAHVDKKQPALRKLLQRNYCCQLTVGSLTAV